MCKKLLGVETESVVKTIVLSVMQMAGAIAEAWRDIAYLVVPDEESPSTGGVLPCCAVVSQTPCPFVGRVDRTAWVGVWISSLLITRG